MALQFSNFMILIKWRKICEIQNVICRLVLGVFISAAAKQADIDEFQISLPGLITRFSVLMHALYDKSVSRSIVYLASVCDLTQRASVSMRKCANLKFVYIVF